MKPIVSPWTIYFASRADSLKILAGCILICCIIAICIAFIEGDIDYGSVLTHKSFMKKCAIVSVISAVTLVITPSTETIYTMAVVKEITPDNIQAIGKTGKDVIDYITDQIDKVINDKEENNKQCIQWQINSQTHINRNIIKSIRKDWIN